MKLLIIFIGLIMSGLASAADISPANVLRFKVHTTTHSIESVKDITEITVDAALDGDCTYLYIDSSESAALSTLLAAKAQGSPLAIGYDTGNTTRGGWNSDSCAIYHVEIL